MTDRCSSYATFDGRLIWAGERGRWSVVVDTGDPDVRPSVHRYRSKSAARRIARYYLADGYRVRVRAYRRSQVAVGRCGFLEPVQR